MKNDRILRLSRRAFASIAGAAMVTSALPSFAAAAADPGSPRPPLRRQPPPQIWFIRHAESEINLPTNPRNVPDSGVSYPLTRKGVEQARMLAESLAAAPLVTLYTSTHLRAIQTADALAFQHDLTLSLAPEAVELDLGLTRQTSTEIRALYDELLHRWLVNKDLDARHGEGESFADLQRRFLPFVREIMNRHANRAGIVVVVSHGATLGLMVPVLATNVPADLLRRHPLPNTGIIKTELRDSRLFCTEWAGIPADELGE